MERNGMDVKFQQLSIESNTRFKVLKWARTFAMISAWISMGFYSEVSGPTLPYLKQRVDSNYEEISRVMVARAVGFLVGALGGGMLCDRFVDYCDLWFALAQLLAATGVGLAPFCTLLPVLAMMFALDGFAKGIIASGSSSMILRLWGIKAAPPTHALHFGFGVGALIVPQLARPFLPHETKNGHDTAYENDSNVAMATPNVTDFNTSVMSTSASIQLIDPPIEIPFGIVSAITAAVGIWFLVLFCFRTPLPPLSTPTKPITQRRRSSMFRAWMPEKGIGNNVLWFSFVTFLCIFWIFPTGAERAYGRFIYAYAIEGPHELSTDDGTIVETLFWSTFTGTRLLTIMVSYWVPASILIGGSLLLSIGVSVVLAFFSQNQVLVLWIFNCAFGVVLAPVLPASIAWADRYITMTAMMTALAFIASAAGAFIFSWLSGSLYESAGPPSLMHLLVAYSVLCTLVFSVLLLLGRKKGPRELEQSRAKKAPAQQAHEADVLQANPEQNETNA